MEPKIAKKFAPSPFTRVFESCFEISAGQRSTESRCFSLDTVVNICAADNVDRMVWVASNYMVLPYFKSKIASLLRKIQVQLTLSKQNIPQGINPKTPKLKISVERGHNFLITDCEDPCLSH